MFSKLAIFASFALLAVATPMPGGSSPSGTLECCDTVGKASDPSIATTLEGLGITVQDIDALVGLTCSPITVIGVGDSGSCSTNTVSCTDTSHGDAVSLGCVPVTL